jgi:hypothetical protein
MQRIALILLFLGLESVLLWAADERILGTWNLNAPKSTFSPGPSPKGLTQIYLQAGEWVVVQYTGVNAEGKEFKTSNRYKWDGSEYPYESAVSGSGKIVAKKIDDDHYEAHVKAIGGGHVTISDAISKDGKTRTQKVVGINAEGQTVSNTEIFEKQ